MIGGGGGFCARADHGIGITEADAASFVDGYGRCTDAREHKHDFGYGSVLLVASIPVLLVKSVDSLIRTNFELHFQ